MLLGKRICVIMPAYNAARTLVRTYREVREAVCVDDVVIVDDGSTDGTVEVAQTLTGAVVAVHPKNRGYGANQKSCFQIALELRSDVIVMVHPDYQYTPKLVMPMAHLIAVGLYECVLGSRILGGQARRGGMPAWKYLSNRGLTWFENVLLGAKLSEYHSGLRAFSARLLRSLPWPAYSDDFVFDNEVLAGTIWQGHTVCEITCPARYAEESSSIRFGAACRYGLGCVATAVRFRLAKWGVVQTGIFGPGDACEGLEMVEEQPGVTTL